MEQFEKLNEASRTRDAEASTSGELSTQKIRGGMVSWQEPMKLPNGSME
ncbi:hypothetical protein M2281_002489 [Mesorhizobium soli]|nr:hypothetical protein [Mesorhizobium soli]MDH6231891.1 hypothetical protein [Mesorhizobium soli]